MASLCQEMLPNKVVEIVKQRLGKLESTHISTVYLSKDVFYFKRAESSETNFDAGMVSNTFLRSVTFSLLFRNNFIAICCIQLSL